MARTRQGGNRTPAKPAAVSGPGALSRRTDGPVQPVRSHAAEQHGQRSALEAQQRAAPLAAGSGGPAAGGGGLAGVARPNVFGPTERPSEPPLTGATGPLSTAAGPDPDLLLRAMYQKFKDPRFLRLIRNG